MFKGWKEHEKGQQEKNGTWRERKKMVQFGYPHYWSHQTRPLHFYIFLRHAKKKKDLTWLVQLKKTKNPFPRKLTKLTHAGSSLAFIFINIWFAVGLRRLYSVVWSGWTLIVLIQSASTPLRYSLHINIQYFSVFNWQTLTDNTCVEIKYV